MGRGTITWREGVIDGPKKLEQEKLRGGGYGPERATMNRRGAEVAQLLHVIVGAVALVLREAVAGVLLVVRDHHAIASNLCDDRRGRDAEALAIATDDSRLRQFESGN